MISVVVPIYNSELFIQECIESILTQSYQDFELLLVNDGSTDSSAQICQSYIHKPNVFYIEQENAGVTRARKLGVELAKGEWITFVDSDDTLPQNALGKLISLTKETDVDIVASGSNKDYMHKLFPDIISREKYIEVLYGDKFSPTPWAKLFRRTLFDENVFDFPREMWMGEDLLMNLQLAVNNKKPVRICKDCVYLYRIHNNSISHKKGIDFDYCLKYFTFKANIVSNVNNVSFDEIDLRQKMRFYYMAIKSSNYVIVDQEHPFLKQLRHDISIKSNTHLSDVLALTFHSKYVQTILYFWSRIVDRFRRLFFRYISKRCLYV